MDKFRKATERLGEGIKGEAARMKRKGALVKPARGIPGANSIRAASPLIPSPFIHSLTQIIRPTLLHLRMLAEREDAIVVGPLNNLLPQAQRPWPYTTIHAAA